MKRKFRVRENERIQEIRKLGKSFSNELLVICFLANQLSYTRVGFSINSRIGGAVERNRLKRQLREIVRLRMPTIQSGWDIIFIARQPIRNAEYRTMDAACARLLGRAHLLLSDSESL